MKEYIFVRETRTTIRAASEDDARAQLRALYSDEFEFELRDVREAA